MWSQFSGPLTDTPELRSGVPLCGEKLTLIHPILTEPNSEHGIRDDRESRSGQLDGAQSSQNGRKDGIASFRHHGPSIATLGAAGDI
jgi:hypothetical protein